MTAAEFRVTIERLGLDQRDAATALKVTERTVRRWVAGAQDVPLGVAGDLTRIEEHTADFVAAVIAALEQTGPDEDGVTWVSTYPSDTVYREHHPDVDLPASWHRAAMGRVRTALPWVRLDFAGDEDPS